MGFLLRMLLGMPSRKRGPLHTPPGPDPVRELEKLPGGPVVPLPLEAEKRREAVKAPEDGDGDQSLPPGVLGYAVGVFPGNGPTCSGLTHTGRLTLETARWEAAEHTEQARKAKDSNEPLAGFHSRCAYRAVEIRDIPSGTVEVHDATGAVKPLWRS